MTVNFYEMVPERNKSAEIEGEQRKLEVLENEIAKIPKPKSIYLPTDEVKLLKIRLDGIKSSDIYNDFMQTNQELTRLESSLRYCRYIKSLYVIKEKSINSLSKNNTDLAIQEYEKYLKLPALDIAPSLIQSIQLQLGTITWHKTHSIVLAFNEINEHFQSKMNEKLLNLGWPEVNGEIDHEFISLFLDYTRLHCPSEASLSETTNNDIKTLEGISSGLLTNTIASFDCLALYHRLAFKSHFRGKKKTNQLDKPELYLDYLLGVFKKVSRFLNNVIQSILDDSKNNLIAMHEFISSCLIVVQEKLLAVTIQLMLGRT